ncbi:hypothetical protein ACWGII_29870 [Streptomyces sp. NPDC054855]
MIAPNHVTHWSATRHSAQTFVRLGLFHPQHDIVESYQEELFTLAGY